MWVCNKMVFLCSPSDILNLLRIQTLARGIDVIREMKDTEGAIMFTCPWHKNGQERKPSCGLITRQKPNGLPAGKVHCFACDKTVNLEEFVSNCFGIYDGGVYGLKWLVENFQQADVDNRKDLLNTMVRDLKNGRNKQTQSPAIEYVSEEELDSYRYYHPYMYQRKLTDDIINRYDIGYDPQQQTLTFPQRDLQGRTLFIARRSVNTKYFHYPNQATKPLYGVYELYQLPEFPKVVYVCESMLDALRVCAIPGYYAVALNGLGSSTQFKELSMLPCRKLILATDNDEAGMKARQKIKQNVKNKIITQVMLPPGRKDMNDLTDEEFFNLVEVMI